VTRSYTTWYYKVLHIFKRKTHILHTHTLRVQRPTTYLFRIRNRLSILRHI